MARYVDGYVLPVSKKNLDAYRRHGAEGGKDLGGARRPGLQRMRRQRSRCKDGGLRSHVSSSQARRDGGVRVSYIVSKSR
jgi:uncharacterized protein YbaA (DUF1428 family)